MIARTTSTCGLAHICPRYSRSVIAEHIIERPPAQLFTPAKDQKRVLTESIMTEIALKANDVLYLLCLEHTEDQGDVPYRGAFPKTPPANQELAHFTPSFWQMHRLLASRLARPGSIFTRRVCVCDASNLSALGRAQICISPGQD